MALASSPAIRCRRTPACTCARCSGVCAPGRAWSTASKSPRMRLRLASSSLLPPENGRFLPLPLRTVPSIRLVVTFSRKNEAWQRVFIKFLLKKECRSVAFRVEAASERARRQRDQTAAPATKFVAQRTSERHRRFVGTVDERSGPTAGRRGFGGRGV